MGPAGGEEQNRRRRPHRVLRAAQTDSVHTAPAVSFVSKNSSARRCAVWGPCKQQTMLRGGTGQSPIRHPLWTSVLIHGGARSFPCGRRGFPPVSRIGRRKSTALQAGLFPSLLLRKWERFSEADAGGTHPLSDVPIPDGQRAVHVSPHTRQGTSGPSPLGSVLRPGRRSHDGTPDFPFRNCVSILHAGLTSFRI